MKRIVVLGSTGSTGTQTLDAVRRHADKLEVVVQHNEAPLDTWLPLEYELNQTYGIPETAPFPPLAALREQARLDTLAKLAEKPGGC